MQLVPFSHAWPNVCLLVLYLSTGPSPVLVVCQKNISNSPQTRVHKILVYQRAAKAQASLCIGTDLPEPSLLTYRNMDVDGAQTKI